MLGCCSPSFAVAPARRSKARAPPRAASNLTRTQIGAHFAAACSPHRLSPSLVLSFLYSRVLVARARWFVGVFGCCELSRAKSGAPHALGRQLAETKTQHRARQSTGRGGSGRWKGRLPCSFISTSRVLEPARLVLSLTLAPADLSAPDHRAKRSLRVATLAAWSARPPIQGAP